MASSPTRLSDLPVDILQIICRKLSFVKDFVVFGAVCTLWRSILFQCHQHIPLVLMFLEKYSHDVPIFGFPDLSKHVLSLTKDIYNYCGSSRGWLIIHTYNTLELLNPFSSVNNVVQHPFSNILPLKVVLSNNPLTASNYVVVIIDLYHKLFFFKPGDTSWTPVDNSIYVDAVTYHRDRLYAIDDWGNLILCDINSTPLSVKKVVLRIASDTHNYCSQLLEVAGDLLYIVWNDNLQFRVFKVEPREALELNNLRGHAIFLTAYSSVCVLAADSPNYKPDHIYFSVLNDTGMYNLVDKTIQPFPTTSNTIGLRPVWIQPTLHMMKTTTEVEGPSHN